MKRSKFTDAQIALVLKQAEEGNLGRGGLLMASDARVNGISRTRAPGKPKFGFPT